MNIPTPTVPFSLQFLFCAYAGVLLGSRNALLSQLLYLAIGLIGVPVFTKGGGIGYVLQPSFGFLLGFAICAFIIGFIVERASKPGILHISCCIIRTGIHLCNGALYLYLITNLAAPGNEIDFRTAVAWGVTPFIVFDLIKAAIVSVTSIKILPVLRRFF